MTGQTLGHYRLETLLGEGRSGVVYRARDLHVDHAVTLKVLRLDGRRRRFVHEAKSASALNHESIITIWIAALCAGAGQ